VPADYPGSVAADYPLLLAIVEERVKPQRAESKGANYRDRWWRFAERCPGLCASIEGMKRVLAHPLTAKHNNTGFSGPGIVLSDMTVVLAVHDRGTYSVVPSEIHWWCILSYGNKLETRPQYTPTDCLKTFPFSNTLTDLEPIGERYYSHRQQIMQARQQGLTKTYNGFHDPAETDADIAELRALHVEMDQAVAYGCDRAPGVFDLGHGFHDTK